MTPDVVATRVAVLSVTEPFWTAAVSTLADIADLTRITRPKELDDCLRDRVLFDLVLVAHWRWLIPEQALNLWRCVGFHTSPLPLGRGGSPIQNQILRGLYDSEVCAFSPTREMDAGDVFLRRPVDLSSGSISEILDHIADIAAQMAREILLAAPEPVAQLGPVSVFQRLAPADSELNLGGLTARQIYDRIRMVDGLDYPRAFLTQQSWILEFRDAHLSGEEVTAKVTFKQIAGGGIDA